MNTSFGVCVCVCVCVYVESWEYFHSEEAICRAFLYMLHVDIVMTLNLDMYNPWYLKLFIVVDKNISILSFWCPCTSSITQF